MIFFLFQGFGFHLPLVMLSLEALTVTYAVSLLDDLRVSVWSRTSCHIDVFNKVLKCWEPCLEPLSLQVVSEKSNSRWLLPFSVRFDCSVDFIPFVSSQRKRTRDQSRQRSACQLYNYIFLSHVGNYFNYKFKRRRRERDENGNE